MKPYSKEAEAALCALEVIEPTSADEARVRAGLERALGIALPAATVATASAVTAAAAATGATAAAAQAATSTAGAGAGVSTGLAALGLGTKSIVLLAAVASALTVGVKISRSTRAEPEPVLVAPVGRVVREPAPVEAQGPLVELGPEVAGEPEVEETAIEVRAAQESPSSPPPSTVAAVSRAPHTRAQPPSQPPQPSSSQSGFAVSRTPQPEGAAQTAASAEEVLHPPPLPPPEGPAQAPTSAGEVAYPPPLPPSPAPEAQTYQLEVENDFPLCDVDTEKKSAVRARQLLSQNQPQEALWLLGAFQRRCPSGLWSLEAWEVRMASLCRLGRHAEVRGLLRWFGAEYPAQRPALVAELGTTCPSEVLGPIESPAE